MKCINCNNESMDHFDSAYDGYESRTGMYWWCGFCGSLYFQSLTPRQEDWWHIPSEAKKIILNALDKRGDE